MLKYLQLQCFCTTLRRWRHFGIAIVKTVYRVGAQVSRLCKLSQIFRLRNVFNFSMLGRNVTVTEILTCSSHFLNRLLAACRLIVDYFTRYHHGIYHLERKQIFAGLKKS